MFRTKEDVKRHVQEVFRKVKSENERYRRCYNIAQHFFKVRDYESAKNYLSMYLSVKENSPLAHKLQGQIWEGLGDKVRALNAYKTSLEYDGNQADLILKLCELLCETDVAMDPDRAQCWCDRAADHFPYDPTVFRLKEKLLKMSGKNNTNAFEDLINSEVKARPNDVNVRIRLMRLYLETGRAKAAFNHALELEANQMFHKELVWYECFAEVCQCYVDGGPGPLDWQFFCTWVSVLDRVAGLSMEEPAAKKLVDCIQAIFNMDQVMFKADKVTPPKEYTEIYKQFRRHMSAQLCLHIATLILKRAKKEPSNWRESTDAVAPVLFLALNPPPDSEAPWCGVLLPNQRHALARWVDDGYYRISQAGYTLLSLSKDAGKPFTEKVSNIVGSANWRERTYQRIFTVMDHRAKMTSSHFVNSELLSKVAVRLPSHNSGSLRTSILVPTYEKVRESFHQLVWLGLQIVRLSDGKLPPEFHTTSFTRLKLASHNMANCSADSLCQLDVDAFLYAAVLCAAATQEEEILSGFYSGNRPKTLPADISNLLCTQEQISWWRAARQVHSQQWGSSDLVATRQQLQSGLEVVRVDNNHGLDVQLIVKLARTFADRATTVTDKASVQAALESRASLYWNAAVPLLERLERNQSLRISNCKLFEYPRKELSAAEITSLLEEGRYFVACQFMKIEQFERALEAFKPLRSPYSSFNMALIYKKLATLELESRPREEITSEMRSKHVILLSKARECLGLTMERIRIDRRHPLHLSLPALMEEVEAALSRIEPDPDLDRNILGTARSLDLSMQHLGVSFHSSYLNRSDGEVAVSEPSFSSMSSPAAGDSLALPRLNGTNNSHHRSTPRHAHTRQSENRRRHTNGDLIDVGQLLQIQTLHEDMKKMHEKFDMILENMSELRKDVNDMKKDMKFKPPAADDLYLFGDEEEYPEDVLGGQFPPTFVPSYPTAQPIYQPAPAPRGVQGTSTVTYGAPPPVQQAVIPLNIMRMPLDPNLASLHSQNLAFFNQFAEPQQLPDFLRTPIKPVVQPPPPVNVVITTSDTLPTGPPPVQPMLSVTIPPQHRLGTPATPVTAPTTPAPVHQFQIELPASATTPNFEKSPIQPPEQEESEDETEANYDPCPDFQPIIPLPSEVSVTTGEEDDDVLFQNRAKLFRFIDKEWKERGVGVVKILKNRATDKVRLLMRRDQVHKVCANHLLKADMELTALKNSDRALVWVANDFAEEVVQLEKFCIKFKTPEEATMFQEVFNDSKAKYGHSPEKPKYDPKVKEKSPVKEVKPTDFNAKVNVGGFTFTSPPKLKEPVEEKMKVEEVKKVPQATPSPFAAFSFTSQKSAGNASSNTPAVLKQPVLAPSLFAGLNSTQNKHSLFKNKEDDSSQQPSLFKVPNDAAQESVKKEPEISSPQSFGNVLATNETQDGSKPQPSTLFNLKSQTLIANSTKETPKSILKESPSVNASGHTQKPLPAAKHVLFQDSPSQQTPTLTALLTSPKTSVVDFAALSKMNENSKPQFGATKTSGFEGAGSTVFGNINRVRNDSEGENAEEFVPSAEFQPVIPLPELVEVKTGEEDEQILFNERAKLMRFDPDAKEWKERGLGQMKILKDPATGVTRFLMRREQVHKVCCNHRIIQSLEMRASPSSEKAWTWYAVDYSEGEIKNELFAIRFKTVELAKSFKEVVDKVQKQLREEGTCKRSCPDSAPQEETGVPGGNKPKSETNTLPKLSEMFRPKAGSWECKACYTVNGAKDNTCVSCDSPKEKPKSPAPTTPEKTTPTPLTTGSSLAEMFKPKAGSWECGGCLVRNNGDITICPACSTPKPGHEGDAKEAIKLNNSFGGSFSFGIKPTEEKTISGFSFGIPSTDTPKSSFIFGVKQPESTTKSSEPTSGFSFKSGSGDGVKTSMAPTGFVFGQSAASTATPFSFAPKTQVVSSTADSTTAAPAQEPKAQGTFNFTSMFGNVSSPSTVFGTPPRPSAEDGDKFAFGQSNKFEFSFSGVKSPRSPGGGKSPRSPSTGQDTDSEPEYAEEEESDHIVFQPVVPLPDKVPLTTGEEEETVLYSHRAKLFRFALGEWKERGVGDIKILRHNDTHKIRFLMRREPIMKICLNHYLTPELVLTPKDDKSWLWSAQDYAEGTLTNEQFCLRVKTSEIAAEFKAAVDSAQGELQAAGTEDKPSSVQGAESESSSHGEVEIVYEARVSEELRQAALRLQLPPNFYSYLNSPPCPGCAGCEPDSDEEESTKSRDRKSSTILTKPLDSSTPVTTTSATQPFTFSFKTTTASSTPPLSLFGSASTATLPSTPQSTFSFSLNTASTTIAPVFSSNSQPMVTGTSFFGGSPIFQSQTNAKSLFGGTSTTKSGPLLFGTTTTTQSANTLSFATPQVNNSTTSAPSIFGGSPSTVFGTPANESKKEPFVNNTLTKSSVKPTSSIFGGSPATIFGTASSDSPNGSTFFNNLTTFQSPQSSLFGGSSTQAQSPASVFGNAKPSVFGVNSQSGLFSSLSTQEETTTEPTFLFKPTTTFSDIAATGKPPTFGADDGNFSWSGAGAPVFGGSANPKPGEESGGESGGEEGDADASHDPVFEPIVPLPDAIEVRTGEEDEERVFCQRAKFYRYDVDAREWKERGVGDMKILKHRLTDTYRLLLRREQVHKVVCNQLVTTQLDMQLMINSDKAFCWANMNMAEEYSEPRLEKMAVRFSNPDIAVEFKAKLDECIAGLKTKKDNSLAESLDSSAELLEPVVAVEDYSDGDLEGDDDYGEEDEAMFVKSATLHVLVSDRWATISDGELSVTFNSSTHCADMMFKKDDGEQIMISAGLDSNLQRLCEKEVSWSGQDYGYSMPGEEFQEYKATFLTAQDADEFMATGQEILDLSQVYESSYLGSGTED